MTTFSNYSLGEDLLKAIQELNFVTPTEIQQRSIPLLLEDEMDLIALAQTGTGKTAAFGLPLLEQIDAKNPATQALVLSPTRELCLQITQELKNYAKYTDISIVPVYGGSDMVTQIKQVKRGASVIVATPGRLTDLLRQKVAKLSATTLCVLDEADEMLNMGFQQDVDSIISATSKDKKVWLFSATMSKAVESIAKKFMDNPHEILIGKKNAANLSIEHESYIVNSKNRFSALKRLVDCEPDIFGLIFCRTKLETQRVAEKLIEGGYNSGALHGDLNQNQRDLVMKSFRSRKIQMLVATDVAARGLDVENITHVIHYQLPDEMETYNHRSGRTGRAGKKGKSVILGTTKDKSKINRLARTLQTNIVTKNLPGSDMICHNHIDSYLKKLKQVDVHESIDKYSEFAQETLLEMDKEMLIKKILSQQFAPFLNYYAANPIASQSLESGETRSNSSDETVRYFITLGESDGFTWQKLKDYLCEILLLDSEHIFHVDVTPNYAFFNTSVAHKDKVLATIFPENSKGYAVNVEVASKKTKKGGAKKRSDSKGDRGRKDFSSFKPNKAKDNKGKKDRWDKQDRKAKKDPKHVGFSLDAKKKKKKKDSA